MLRRPVHQPAVQSRALRGVPIALFGRQRLLPRRVLLGDGVSHQPVRLWRLRERLRRRPTVLRRTLRTGRSTVLRGRAPLRRGVLPVPRSLHRRLLPRGLLRGRSLLRDSTSGRKPRLELLRGGVVLLSRRMLRTTHVAVYLPFGRPAWRRRLLRIRRGVLHSGPLRYLGSALLRRGHLLLHRHLLSRGSAVHRGVDGSWQQLRDVRLKLRRLYLFGSPDCALYANQVGIERCPRHGAVLLIARRPARHPVLATG